MTNWITVNGLPIGGGGGLGPNTVGTVEVIDGSLQEVDLGFDPHSGGQLTSDYTVLNASGPVDPSVVDLVLVDSTTGVIAATLPASPADGTMLTVKWWLGANGVSVDGNGKLIDGLASVSLDTQRTALKFTFSSFYDEWVIT